MTTTRTRRVLCSLAAAPLLATGLATSATSVPTGLTGLTGPTGPTGLTGPVTPRATAVAAPAPCRRGSGVSVVVDFGASRRTGCAPGDPRTGLAALRAAGFETVMVARFPAMVCRINGFPKPSADACVMPPLPSRYWSYWHATRGGKWTYSSGGAATYDPKPGTVEGWAYGAGKPPRVPPPARAASVDSEPDT